LEFALDCGPKVFSGRSRSQNCAPILSDNGKEIGSSWEVVAKVLGHKETRSAGLAVKAPLDPPYMMISLTTLP
jgi:hypothetical protein